MPRTKKKAPKRSSKDKTHDYIDDASPDEADDEELPSDEAGRRKIKKNYEAAGSLKAKNKNEQSSVKTRQDNLKAEKQGNNVFEKNDNKHYHPLPFHLEP